MRVLGVAAQIRAPIVTTDMLRPRIEANRGGLHAPRRGCQCGQRRELAARTLRGTL